MKITLVISHFGHGGAERVLVLLAKAFGDQGHEVKVVTLSTTETDFYSLPKGTYRLALGMMRTSPNLLNALGNNFYRLLKLRHAICSTDPDIVISFLTEANVLTLLSLIATKYPIIATEHNDPRFIACGKIWDWLRRFTYPYAAKIVSVSRGVNDAFDWLAINKKTVIYNPFLRVEDQEIITDLPKGFDINKKWVISMGRLSEQKGFDILLSAFAKIADRHPTWQLLILGKGNIQQQEKLEKMKEDLGLTKQVILPGAIKNPFPILKKAKLFVMASRREGFPMAHGEAMACGLPVIATDCHSGPREIIRHNLDGILVPNEDISALATAMDHLMSNEKERQRLAIRAPEVTERFSLENVISMWEALFKKVLSNNN
ncbi:glycosyltransferase [Cylindrospermum stagnale PCC 7417]|uniref:Glycosyltransferase n=1 Tax=Cylindrospermum stagnale PCC 7417 TaxID=56107 RepID=K9X2I5_9NOST|nr:glycosyltransferase family 4 protein [Cylindrospermum stagnale]AFZ26294.1 glycosyltransferase [Cylindrospermum stagnale PCC 7417]